MTQDTSTIEAPLLETPLSEIDLLGIKLQEEILHLEKWMSAQQKKNTHRSSNAIVSTIQELIQTRKKLLSTLQKGSLADASQTPQTPQQSKHPKDQQIETAPEVS